MKVIITPDSIELGPDSGSVAYYPYYIDLHCDTQAEDRLVVMQKIIVQWASALEGAKDGQKLYLPYSLDDQEVECFEAVLQDNEVTFRCVEVHWNGYAMVLDDISEFMNYHPHEFWSARAELFATYDKNELIYALRSAELIDEQSG